MKQCIKHMVILIAVVVKWLCGVSARLVMNEAFQVKDFSQLGLF